ncbi:hypothetical protein SAMN05660236_5701 [Ohtaekwangia koreensis]|uniref:Uncharacterized protein n=1 Tax=Ohtaekwangia koreensis TaxID=688867 RepID=A0A1T5MLP0_9BACT|nr:hypothetical protein SAMN05660236_5701 [Ohtaekwangia koreensis]
MDSVIDFIKNFKFPLSDLDFWGLLITFGIIILIFVIANWLISFLNPTTARTTKRILTIIFYSVFFFELIFVVLNAILTENYNRLTVMVFMIAPYYIRLWIGKFYKRYDKLVDKLASKD